MVLIAEFQFEGAVQRWFLTQSQKAGISRRCEEMANIHDETNLSKELSASRLVLELCYRISF